MSQTKFDRFFPVAVTTGTNMSVKVEGKFSEWPCEALSDRSDVLITATAEKGEFRVSVAKGAPQGIAWLRFYDKTVVSKWMPLLIERQPVVAEEESNDFPKVAQKSELPISINGRLSKSEDVDCYQVELQKGQSLRAQVVADRILGSPMDSVIQVVDLRGNVLAQQDDRRGLDPQILFQAPARGAYVVRVFAFPKTPNSTIGFAGGADFVYVLRMDTSPCVEYFLPLIGLGPGRQQAMFSDGSRAAIDPAAAEWGVSQRSRVSPPILSSREASGWQWASDNLLPSSDSNEISFGLDSDSGDVIWPPAICSGVLDDVRQVDAFKLLLQKAKKYHLRLYSQELGYQLDSRIRILGPDGSEAASNDDRASKKYDSGMDFTAKVDGEHTVRIEDVADSASVLHAYSLTIAEAKPGVSLTLATDRFSMKPSANLEIPVLISRVDGFADPLQISVAGLPDGISCPSVDSEPKGKSSGTVKLKLEATAEVAAGHYRLQVKATNQTDKAASAVLAQFPLRKQVLVSEVWLTVAL